MNPGARQTFSISFLLVFVLMIQACSSQPVPTSVATSVNASSSTTTPTRTENPAQTSSLSPLPETSTTSTIPSPIASSSPVDTRAEKIRYVLNKYTVSNGKQIYYSDGTHVYLMDLNGKNIIKTAIKRFHKFIAITDTRVYFIQDDPGYKKTKYEGSLQYCYAYNLQYFDKKTGSVKTIQKRISEAIEIAGTIYTIDHTDHSKILAYKINSKDTTRVTGSLPPDTNRYQSVSIMSMDGIPYVVCNSIEGDEYIIQNNIIQRNNISPVATSQLQQEYFNQQGQADGAFQWGSREYLVSVDWNMEDEPVHKIGVLVTQYNNDGTEKDIFDTYCDQVSIGTWCELVNGWIFVFWDSGPEGGTADQIIFKYQIPAETNSP